MLSPISPVLISTKFVFAEHRYIQIFNTEYLVRDGGNEGKENGNHFWPKVGVWSFVAAMRGGSLITRIACIIQEIFILLL